MSSEESFPDELLQSVVSDDWLKCVSRRYQSNYWMSLKDGSSRWEYPAEVESRQKKRRFEDYEGSNERHLSPSNGTELMKSTDGSEELLQLVVSDDWLKCVSRRYQSNYWMSLKDGSSRWEYPAEVESRQKKRRFEDYERGDERHLSSLNDAKLAVGLPRKRKYEDYEKSDENHLSNDNIPSNFSSQKTAKKSTKMEPEIAIIVPYRDLHKEQCRKQQLDLFIPSISKFMELNKDRSSYRIYIIEQSNDGRKFNRGKLLNIGSRIACADGCKALIFHDVDLLPSPDLNKYYYTIPVENPIHIARVWDRYSLNTDYFGGITSFSIKQFEDINGFPNNFWGWGGEDDELKKRINQAGIKSIFPPSGKITDMEEMSLKTKLEFLRGHKVWKCMNKTEVLAEHSESWKKNGLKTLNYKELSRTEVSGTAVIITVDVCLNSHWTDEVCGVTDTQLEESVEVLKARFVKKRQ